MYEDPNVSEYAVTAVFTFASDAEHEPEMRAALEAEITALVNRLGHDVEIHSEDMLSR